MPHLFFSHIYTARQILIGFAYSSIPVGFRAISISFLSFLSQKTYPGKFLRWQVILSRSYLRKCSISSFPLSSSICHFLNSEPLGVLEANIFRIFISLWYLPNLWGKGCINLELPNDKSFLLATLAMITIKMSFTHFS